MDAIVTKPVTKVVFAGHVDHGKSTLLGRTLVELDALPEGRMESIKASCKRRGIPFEWAFLLDALKAERDQGITIDTTQVQVATPNRRYVFIDAPGHHEFIKNMVTGAAQADAAVLLLDAQEGIQEQTRRHAFLLHLLGIRRVVLAVTKMDLVNHSEQRYKELTEQVGTYLLSLGFGVENITMIPVAARDGANIAQRSDEMSWYEGSTLIETINEINPETEHVVEALRFPVQDIYKFDHRRILAGRIASGQLRVGDELVFQPGNRQARVSSIESWSGLEDPEGVQPQAAVAGQSIGITLDRQLFVERGATGSHPAGSPTLVNRFRGRLVWFSEKQLVAGKTYTLKTGTGKYSVRVEDIETILDVDSLDHCPGEAVDQNQVADVIFHSKVSLPLDDHRRLAETSRFVLSDTYRIVGCGLIDLAGFAEQKQDPTPKSENIVRVEHHIDKPQRWRANGHSSGILWLTGLSGSGKSTLAIALEETLFNRGIQTYVLDGDNVRHGLCSDLGFSPEDRTENIRRIGETAQILADAGLVVITAFISPYRRDRDKIRARAGDLFHEIHVSASVSTCEGRDPKGLYKKARAGEIPEFTGISAPYEPPLSPELTIDTDRMGEEASIEVLVNYALQQFGRNRGTPGQA